MRRVAFACALFVASTQAVTLESTEPAELEFEDDYEFPELYAEGEDMDYDGEYDEFPEVDADGKQFMAKVGRGLSYLGNKAKNGIVAGAKAMDAAADRALVGTQNAVSNGIAGAKRMGH